jgi:hypothetical protein
MAWAMPATKSSDISGQMLGSRVCGVWYNRGVDGVIGPGEVGRGGLGCQFGVKWYGVWSDMCGHMIFANTDMFSVDMESTPWVLLYCLAPHAYSPHKQTLKTKPGGQLISTN